MKYIHIDLNPQALLAAVTLVAIVAGNLSYHLYTNAKNREAYMECLRITERLLVADKTRISTPYCRL